MIYDQYYLQSQGLAVTWDNPDIHITDAAGNTVPQHELAADTTYRVVANVWNLSTQAPAVNMPVSFSFLTFGIGTTRTFIGETSVDLAVKGSTNLPAVADVLWKTPAQPGHYCLQVELIWPDDANPDNNLGQSNTDVKTATSPATFEFPVRNENLLAARVVRLEVDAYAIPPQPRCDTVERRQGQDAVTDQARRREVIIRHDRASFPVPSGWEVRLSQSELQLEPGQQQQVTVTVLPPKGFTGRQALNVNAYDGSRMAGGVTLYVEA